MNAHQRRKARRRYARLTRDFQWVASSINWERSACAGTHYLEFVVVETDIAPPEAPPWSQCTGWYEL